MIVTALFSFFMMCLDVLPSITIDNVDSIIEYYSYGIQIVVQGMGVFRLFFGDLAVTSIVVFLGGVLAINFFYLAYQVIWFALTKIPMLNIKQ